MGSTSFFNYRRRNIKLRKQFKTGLCSSSKLFMKQNFCLYYTNFDSPQKQILLAITLYIEQIKLALIFKFWQNYVFSIPQMKQWIYLSLFIIYHLDLYSNKVNIYFNKKKKGKSFLSQRAINCLNLSRVASLEN